MTTETATRVHTAPKVAADVSLIAVFAAFIAVCALIPGFTPAGSAVPITLQTFGVMLAGAVLGWRRGLLAVLLYIGVGLAGLPIFSGGGGGLGVLARPSLGYIIAWPLAVALAGLLVQAFARNSRVWVNYLVIFFACMAGSLLFTHPLGIWVMSLRAELPATEAISIGLLYLPGDVLKNLAVAAVAVSVHRAFPQLLPRLGSARRMTNKMVADDLPA